MSKALDTVHHNILCNKLSYYGFKLSSAILMLSYLSKRTQFVYKDGHYSLGREVKYRALQGSEGPKPSESTFRPQGPEC